MEEVDAVWQEIAAGTSTGVVSCISIFELQRVGLKGSLNKAEVDFFLDNLSDACEVVWLDEERLRRAAHLAHGNGLAMADAIILTSLMAANVEVIYSSDSDFEVYLAGPRIIKI